MQLEDRRIAWNTRAVERLAAAGHLLPASVWHHALGRRWTPRTLRAAVDGYWRGHPIRAERLSRALARRSGTPEGWAWRAGPDSAGSFRMPPLPYRETGMERGPGHCVVCGQAVHRLGWHSDIGGKPGNRAVWHAACVVAWKFWTAPSDHRTLLATLQARRCALSGRRLLKTAHVDHRIPLFEVWRDRRDVPWPDLIAHWGVPNLQVINSAMHVEKSVGETRARALVRAAGLLAP